MKAFTKYITSILAFMIVFFVYNPKKAEAQLNQVSFQVFYDQLSPYGEWIDDPDYGYIWLPDVAPGFQPYATNGRWVNTQYGNTWVSNYDWGWAPFHYGRWVQNRYGWAWVPGYEWAPAWVSWRHGGGQYGWAPLSPGMNFSVSVNIPLSHWVFIPQSYLFHANLHRYYTPHRRYNSFYNRTTIINNVYVVNNRNYYGGPARKELAYSTKNRVVYRNLETSTRPGRNSLTNNSVSLYRPEIDRSSASRARPSRVASNSARDRGSSSSRVTNNNQSASKNSRATNNRATRPSSNNRNETRSPEQAKNATRSVRQAQSNRSERGVTSPRTEQKTNGTAARPSQNANSRPAQSTRSAREGSVKKQERRSAPVARSTPPSKQATPQKVERNSGNQRRSNSTPSNRAPAASQRQQSRPQRQVAPENRSQRSAPVQRVSNPRVTRSSTPDRGASVRSSSKASQSRDRGANRSSRN